MASYCYWSGPLLGLVLLLAGAPSAFSEEPARAPSAAPTTASVASQLANVRRLISLSSGAKRVEASGNPQALADRERAGEIYARAEAEYQAGRLATADKLLKEATQAMFAAIRAAGADDVLAEKRRNDFEARAESVDAMLAALQRVAAEKGAQSRVAPTVRQVQAQAGEARSLAAAGKRVEGRAVLDRAYESAKLAIEDLRGGDTLVRSLSFANKAEEYRYELDRNDTHKLLVGVLLEQKGAGAGQMVQQSLQRAAALRQEAERQAARGDHGAAVKTLELSTKEYIRAIRGAGVYIPG
jgi:hypothetical protein